MPFNPYIYSAVKLLFKNFYHKQVIHLLSNHFVNIYLTPEVSQSPEDTSIRGSS